MPFGYGPYNFTEAEIDSVYEVGGVYGLARPSGLSLLSGARIVYVGKAVNLRKRLKEHFNNPPVSGITHFYAEAFDTDAARTQREYALIQEFQPIGNTLLK